MSEYINRQLLLDAMGEAARDLDTEEIADVDDMLDALEDAMRQCVYDAPAADVAPVRHGKIVWKSRTVGGFERHTGIENVGEFGETHTVTVDERYEAKVPYCSECGKKLDDTFLRFCPNCGAKMDGCEQLYAAAAPQRGLRSRNKAPAGKVPALVEKAGRT